MVNYISGEALMSFKTKNSVPKNFVIDLDGVFTDGKFYYGENGKVFKAFSVDDHDAIKFLNKYIVINVITADSLGLSISKKRIVDDMGLSLDLVSTKNRLKWLTDRFDLNSTIYMGDGILDPAIFRAVHYSIAPSSALKLTKKRASFVTESKGGERAVAEACLHIAKVFFQANI
jgi:3-deoxy-D-manno-octulosonate 8-phosphate phosphatase (KDO 8-P phosphatase)